MPDANSDPPAPSRPEAVAISALAVVFDLELRPIIPDRRARRKARDRDYIAKREEYLELGLAEYWIVDRLDGCVTVLSGTEADVWAERVFRDEEMIVSPMLPGFALRVSELWAGVDDEADEVYPGSIGVDT